MAHYSRDILETMGQLTLWVNPVFVWDASIELEIRRIAPLKARECSFHPSEWSEFEAFCVERLFERSRKGKGLKGIEGVARAVNNLSIDWVRRGTRKKRAPTEDVAEYADTVPATIEDTDQRVYLNQLAEEFPFLAVVGAARAAGFADQIISAAFGLTRGELCTRIEGDRAAASLQ